MNFEISHYTEYRYESPVSLSPHTMRLRAREDGTLRLHTFQLSVEPSPATVSAQVDVDGTTTLLATFSQPAKYLRIHARSTVETHRSNPFDYFITALPAMQLPVKYEPRLARVLSPSLEAVEGDAVSNLADSVAAAAGNDTLRFLSLLNQGIHQSTKIVLRLDGDPMAPDECLAAGEGACRDVAVLFMAACRRQGIAARFVSGYQLTDPDEQERHMHAWAEVYLPGGGWRGFDPTHGVAVNDHYVPVAASPIPSLAAPIEGSYAPHSVTSRMKIDVDVRSPCLVPPNNRADGTVPSGRTGKTGAGTPISSSNRHPES